MNALFIASRFASLVVVDQPLNLKSIRVAGSMPVVDPQPAHRRNRYAHRAFGVGYGSSQGYSKARTYLATPSLSRYR